MEGFNVHSQVKRFSVNSGATLSWTFIHFPIVTVDNGMSPQL